MEKLLLVTGLMLLCLSTGQAYPAGESESSQPGTPLMRHMENAKSDSKMEELPYAEGEFKEILATGPNHYAINCNPNLDMACYEYNKYEKWVRLCDGSGTIIAYVVSVTYVGQSFDPDTGQCVDVYEVETSSQ